MATTPAATDAEGMAGGFTDYGEELVARAIAAADPIAEDGSCIFCGGWTPVPHDPECVWVQAVATHSTRPRAEG